MKDGRPDLVGPASAPALRPFRVLSLDGGGMRGVYTATYLGELAHAFARKRGVAALDVGRGFDLIVGTSTGGIVACCSCQGTASLSEVVRRTKEKWGDRERVARSARHVLQSVRDWAVLTPGGSAGVYEPALSRKPVSRETSW